MTKDWDMPRPPTMPQIITYVLPAEERGWSPDLFPGSEEAMKHGCTCPELQPWPGSFHFSSDCPVHELERVKS